MRLFYFILRPARVLVVITIAISMLSGASSTGLIALIHHVLGNGEFQSPTFLWGFVGLLLVMFISGFSSQWLLEYLSHRTIAELRMNLSRKIAASPLRHLEELGAARLLGTLIDDIYAISGAIIRVPCVVTSAATVVGGALYMVWLSWTGFASLIGLIGLGIGVYYVLTRWALKALIIAREDWDKLLKHFHALTEGLKELKLHRKRREGFFSHTLHPTIKSLQYHHQVSRTFFILADNLTRFLFFVLFGLVIFLLPNLTEIDTKTLTGYTLIILYLFRPLGEIMGAIPHFGRGAVALKKVDELEFSLTTYAPDEEATTGALANIKPVWKCLELHGVSHVYYREQENSSFNLGPIDLAFHPGELVFLVGGNGSGKTTLAKLLTGLYPPETGEIRLDGELITEKNRDDYRQLFSVVFSDFYLFEGLLGLENPNLDAQAQEYLIQLQLNHKVKVEEGRLSTTDLSQGQRKRLALLTAYLEDRPFYVFDEWAADQDPLFKKMFYTQLLPELKARGKTVLVISHDDRYFHVADRCIKMEDGKCYVADPKSEYNEGRGDDRFRFPASSLP